MVPKPRHSDILIDGLNKMPDACLLSLCLSTQINARNHVKIMQEMLEICTRIQSPFHPKPDPNLYQLAAACKRRMRAVGGLRGPRWCSLVFSKPAVNMSLGRRWAQGPQYHLGSPTARTGVLDRRPSLAVDSDFPLRWTVAGSWDGPVSGCLPLTQET